MIYLAIFLEVLVCNQSFKTGQNSLVMICFLFLMIYLPPQFCRKKHLGRILVLRLLHHLLLTLPSFCFYGKFGKRWGLKGPTLPNPSISLVFWGPVLILGVLKFELWIQVVLPASLKVFASFGCCLAVVFCFKPRHNFHFLVWMAFGFFLLHCFEDSFTAFFIISLNLPLNTSSLFF